MPPTPIAPKPNLKILHLPPRCSTKSSSCVLDVHFSDVHLHASSVADLDSLWEKLGVAIWELRSLDRLAQSTDLHRLETLDLPHVLEELAGGAVGVHAALDVLVVQGALLEETNRVPVIAETFMGILKGLWNDRVGVHDQS